MQLNVNNFTRDILYAAEQEIPSVLNYTAEDGTQIPIYKGTLQQTKDGKRFTFIKVDDRFITKLTEVAKEKLDSQFRYAPYLSKGHDGMVGAHVSLSEGGVPAKLLEKDQGKEVYFRLKPSNVWDWNQKGGYLLNGRVLAVTVEILGGEGVEAMNQYGFSTNHPHHITFAMKPN
jgi:hypothetical protein